MTPKTVLCFSRSYLVRLLPLLAADEDSWVPLHVVQTDAEARQIEQTGQKVAFSLETVVREALALPDAEAPIWQEPADLRDLTGYGYDPIYGDRYLPAFPEAKRRVIAGAIQQAFDTVFATHDIAGALSEPVALFPTHYLLYLCKRHDAVPLYWATAYFGDWFYFVDGIDVAMGRRRAPMSPDQLQAVQTQAQTYLDGVANDLAGPAYHHKFATRKQNAGRYFAQRRGEDALILTPSLGAKVLQAARLVRAGLKAATFPWKSDYMSAASLSEHRFYMGNLMTPQRAYDRPADSYSKTNIFFPLQYEPEASLLYHAPDSRNQLAVVEAMAQALPAGHVLWVKEHPNQFGALGSRAWRKLRKRYSNLRFVYGRENGRHLIQRCGLAVAITSTAGMDAMTYGRRCIVLGDVWFRDFPLAVPVRSIEGLAQALNDPENYGETEDVQAYTQGNLDAVMGFAQACYFGDPQPSTMLNTPENLTNLRIAIRAELGLE